MQKQKIKKNVYSLDISSLQTYNILEQTFIVESYLEERVSCAKIENTKKVYGLHFPKFAWMEANGLNERILLI